MAAKAWADAAAQLQQQRQQEQQQQLQQKQREAAEMRIAAEIKHARRQELAADSARANAEDPVFRELFPELLPVVGQQQELEAGAVGGPGVELARSLVLELARHDAAPDHAQ